LNGFQQQHRIGIYDSFGESIRHATFDIVTIASDRGYATQDFATWPVFAPMWSIARSVYPTTVVSPATELSGCDSVSLFQRCTGDMQHYRWARDVASRLQNTRLTALDRLRRNGGFHARPTAFDLVLLRNGRYQREYLSLQIWIAIPVVEAECSDEGRALEDFIRQQGDAVVGSVAA
jgi:hypothetical protein